MISVNPKIILLNDLPRREVIANTRFDAAQWAPVLPRNEQGSLVEDYHQNTRKLQQGDLKEGVSRAVPLQETQWSGVVNCDIESLCTKGAISPSTLAAYTLKIIEALLHLNVPMFKNSSDFGTN